MEAAPGSSTRSSRRRWRPRPERDARRRRPDSRASAPRVQRVLADRSRSTATSTAVHDRRGSVGRRRQRASRRRCRRRARAAASSSVTRAYWRLPPDLALVLERPRRPACRWSRDRRPAACRRGPRADTRGSRRSTMISRWSSPCPQMSVCPESASWRTRKLGSSRTSRPSASSSVAWSAAVLGSTARKMTGSGICMPASTTRSLSSASTSVSPVPVNLRPTAAAMSPTADLVDLGGLVGVDLQQALRPSPCARGWRSAARP